MWNEGCAATTGAVGGGMIKEKGCGNWSKWLIPAFFLIGGNKVCGEWL